MNKVFSSEFDKHTDILKGSKEHVQIVILAVLFLGGIFFFNKVCVPYESSPHVEQKRNISVLYA